MRVAAVTYAIPDGSPDLVRYLLQLINAGQINQTQAAFIAGLADKHARDDKDRSAYNMLCDVIYPVGK